MSQSVQSKLVLLAVLPFAGAEATLECAWWASHDLPVAVWTVGLSALLGLVTWGLRAATPFAALTGALITASLIFSTSVAPYEPWHTALIPILTVSVLTFAATQAGREKKERMGTAEERRGRHASQVAANLGVATLFASSPIQSWLMDFHSMPPHTAAQGLFFALPLAALAEAAADTASSEVGQVLGGRPRLITTLRAVDPGHNGAISLAGTLAGLFAASLVTGAGMWALGGGWELFRTAGAGAVLGLFFDSLLGATLEECGWLNNDAVNFLSTASAAAFALAILIARH